MNVRKRWSAAFQGYEGGYLYPPVIVVLLEAVASQSIEEDTDTTEGFHTTENSVEILSRLMKGGVVSQVDRYCLREHICCQLLDDDGYSP